MLVPEFNIINTLFTILKQKSQSRMYTHVETFSLNELLLNNITWQVFTRC